MPWLTLLILLEHYNNHKDVILTLTSPMDFHCRKWRRLQNYQMRMPIYVTARAQMSWGKCRAIYNENALIFSKNAFI